MRKRKKGGEAFATWKLLVASPMFEVNSDNSEPATYKEYFRLKERIARLAWRICRTRTNRGEENQTYAHYKTTNQG